MHGIGLIARIEAVTEQDEIFNGLGCLNNFVYDIDLKQNATFEIKPARRVPYSITNELKAELANMVKLDVIDPIKCATPIVSNMVIVKKNNRLRICIDPSELKNNIERRHYPLKTIEEIAARINESKYFTLLGCNRGFWQIKVSQRTQKYLTFATPWGRYAFKRLPFGLASAPEVFQEVMSTLLENIKNTECSMDDILIHSKTEAELNEITQNVINVLKGAGLKLNTQKCVFNKTSVKFFGHRLTSNGLAIDETQVEAIRKLKSPKDKKTITKSIGHG